MSMLIFYSTRGEKTMKKSILFVILFAYSMQSFSALLQVNNGVLFGATDIGVNGTLYDVTFRDGTCAQLFNGCDQNSDFPFSNPLAPFSDTTLAVFASQALLDQVFIDSALGLFDSDPRLINGCTSTRIGFGCQASTPLFVRLGAGSLGIIAAVNFSNELSDSVPAGAGQVATDSGNQIQVTYALWNLSSTTSPDPTPVPAPSVVILLGLGLIGLILTKKISDKNTMLHA